MQRFRIRCGTGVWLISRLHTVAVFLCLCILNLSVSAQCPPNLGFENGNFDHWSCFAGKFDSASQSRTTNPSPPLATRHTIFKKSDKVERDPYGDFPVVCPNGSGYSIRLGNNDYNGEVDGIAYTVTIPPDKDVYSIIYNYAVVLENPNHAAHEQPKFSAKVFDAATNDYIQCSSFDFTASGNLPGFKLSTAPIANSATVYYKPWSPVTIKLVGYAGKTLRIEFVVNDCTLGAHFGYAYLDINEDCSTPIAGNVVCNGANSTILVAPYGFMEYRWYDAGFSTLLGTKNTLPLKPAPSSNTVFAVEVRPFPGVGCVDTLYTSIDNIPVPFVFKMADSTGACPPKMVDITDPVLRDVTTPGLKFSYFIDSSMVDYVERPETVSKPGYYYVKAYNADGCLDLKPIKVVMDPVPDLTVTNPPLVYYPNLGDITLPSLVSSSYSNLSYKYWKDENATIPIPNPKGIDMAGIYYIQAFTTYGCATIKPIAVMMQILPPPNAFSPNNDGVNDYWQIPGLNAHQAAKLSIYDRYGRLVFHSIGYNTPWDGKMNGKPVAIGTYYYVIIPGGELSAMTGSVTVLR